MELSPSRTSTAEKAIGKITNVIKQKVQNTENDANTSVTYRKLSASLNNFLEHSKELRRSSLGVNFICGDIFEPMNIPVVDVYFIAIGRKGRNELIPKLLAAIKNAHLRKKSTGI